MVALGSTLFFFFFFFFTSLSVFLGLGGYGGFQPFTAWFSCLLYC